MKSLLVASLVASPLALIAPLLQASEVGSRPDRVEVTLAPGSKDATAILGRWKLVHVERSGKPTENELGMLITFGQEKMVAQLGRFEIEFEYEIRPDKRPPEIDIVRHDDGSATRILGIYRLEEDVLSICHFSGNEKRPRGFDDGALEDGHLLRFERAAPSTASADKPG